MTLPFLWLLLAATAGGIYFYGTGEADLPFLALQLVFAASVVFAAMLAQRFKKAAMACLLVAAAMAGIVREEQVL